MFGVKMVIVNEKKNKMLFLFDFTHYMYTSST